MEDPGLRAQSTTHVSMELSVRHAAEFFAFYVCRFVLADLGVLLDKFIKRGMLGPNLPFDGVLWGSTRQPFQPRLVGSSGMVRI